MAHYYHRSDVQGPVTQGDKVIVLDRHPAPTPWDQERTLAHAVTDDEAEGEVLRSAGFISDPRKVELTFDEEQALKDFKEGQDVNAAATQAAVTEVMLGLARDKAFAQRDDELEALRARIAELEGTPVKRGPGRPRKEA